MSDIKELIRQEIIRMHQEAVLASYGNDTDWLRSRIGTCVDILDFIDSLPKEKPSEIVPSSQVQNGRRQKTPGRGREKVLSMGTDDLRRMCLALPYKERVLLEADLRKANIEERKRPRAEPRRAAILLKIMEDTVGFPVLTNDRKSAAVWGRTMVAYQLAIEGMPVCEIARQLLKDHATVIFMRRKMADALALPRAYSDIIEIWDRFQEKIGICSEGEE